MKKLLLIILVMLTVGCKTKQKAAEREQTKLAVEESVVEEINITEDFVIKELETAKSVTTETTDNTNEEIEADSTGNVTVEVIKTDTGYIKKYTGVKKVKVTNEKSESKKIDSSSISTDINGKKETTASNESFIKINQETKTRKTNVEIKSSSTWFWIILAIIAILLIAWRIWGKPIKDKIDWL